MGRTIEDSIKYLTALRKTRHVDIEQLSVAIETMCKYQKIERLMNLWQYHEINQIGYKILEVLEDGNDD